MQVRLPAAFLWFPDCGYIQLLIKAVVMQNMLLRRHLRAVQQMLRFVRPRRPHCVCERLSRKQRLL
jgi:hypothetical protein